MIEFRMPSLGADMDEGTLVQWLKAPGDGLVRGDIIAVVETQKGAIEIEVFQDGTLDELRVKPGTKVPVGEVLAILRPSEEAAAQPPARPPVQPAPKPAPVSVPAAPGRLTMPDGLKATPAARALAAKLAVDLSAAAPGPDGVIGLRELGPAATGTAQQKPAAGINLDEMRKAIGAAMARSKREIPHYYVSMDIDLTAASNGLAAQNAGLSPPDRILPAALIIKACALALHHVPELNGHYLDGRFQPVDEIKMGIGIALRGGGLIAPALPNPDALPLDTIMRQLADLVARVRGGRLRSSELMHATVTLSNLGDDSADLVIPVIYPPQVAIIGVGQVAEKAWVVDGKVSVRKVATFALAGDHRANDGRAAARFLQYLKRTLQNPEELWPHKTLPNS